MRLFLALFIEPNALLEDELALLKQKFPEFRFETLERLHLTLWFYGDQLSPAFEQQVIAELKKLVLFDSCNLSLTQPIYLPNSTKPKVYAYKADSPYLSNFMQEIDIAMGAIGLKRQRPFLPHVTLARLSSKSNIPDIEELQLLNLHCLRATEIALVESHLSANGSLYEVKWSKTLPKN